MSPLLRARAPAVRRPLAGAAVAALVALAAPTPGTAQLSPFSLAVRGGLTFPVGGFRHGLTPGGIEAAPAFGVGFVTRNIHGWGMWLGFAQRRFERAGDDRARGTRYVATDVEVAAVRSFGTGHLVPWLRAGFAFGRTEYDAVAGGVVQRRLSDLAAGATAGAGVAVRIGERWGISPGLHYTWMNTRLPGRGLLRMRYLIAGVGLLLTF